MNLVSSISQVLRYQISIIKFPEYHFHSLNTLLVINFTKARFTLRVIRTGQRLDIKKNTCSSQQCVHYGSLVTTVQSQLSCEYLCIFLGQFDKLCTYWLLLPFFEQNFPSLSFNAFSLTTWSQLHSPPSMQRIYAFYWFTFIYVLQTNHFGSLVKTAQCAVCCSPHSILSWGYLCLLLAQFHNI